jgi:hypothetical protein
LPRSPQSQDCHSNPDTPTSPCANSRGMAPIIENSTVDGIHERPGAEPSAPAPTPIRPWVGRQVLTLEQRVRAPHRRRDRGVDGDMAGFHPAVAGSTPAGRSRLGAQLTAGCLILVQVMVRVRIPRPQLVRRGSPNGRGAELKPPSLRVRPPLSARRTRTGRSWRVRHRQGKRVANPSRVTPR